MNYKNRIIYKGQDITEDLHRETGEDRWKYLLQLVDQDPFGIALAITAPCQKFVEREMMDYPAMMECLKVQDIVGAFVGLFYRCSYLMSKSKTHEDAIKNIEAERQRIIKYHNEHGEEIYGRFVAFGIGLKIWDEMDADEVYAQLGAFHACILKSDDDDLPLNEFRSAVRVCVMRMDKVAGLVKAMYINFIDAWIDSGIMEMPQYPQTCEMITDVLSKSAKLLKNFELTFEPPPLSLDETLILFSRHYILGLSGVCDFKSFEQVLDILDSELMLQ